MPQAPAGEQERIIGREKLSDVELPEAVKPSDSHVAATTVTDPDGTARQIVRNNMPFGNAAAGEFGTYFIGYAADPGVVERMLHRMFVGEPAGNTDRILDFSTAVTGCLFFAPPAAFLESPGPTPSAVITDEQPVSVPTVPPPTGAPAAEASASEPRAVTRTGSLGIGSLKRSRKS